jgi:hypothetical protein
MIQRWRAAFAAPALSFIYVELCTQYSMPGFWAAQRAALRLGGVGFATTTDVQRELHPPDKQDVAARLLLELRRVAYAEPVVSRGPELLSHKTLANGSVTLQLSNSTLYVSAGILTGCATCKPKWTGTEPHQKVTTSCQSECTAVCAAAGSSSGVISGLNASNMTVAIPYDNLVGGKLIAHPQTLAISYAQMPATITLNADGSRCFLYDEATRLPAPPVDVVV